MISGISGELALGRVKRVNRAFTLIEMLIVLAIIMGLVALSVPLAKSLTRNARIKETRALISEVNGAILEYHKAWNDYPADLYSDLAKSERNGPFLPAGLDTYIKNGSIVDAWGNTLVYNISTTMPSGVPIIESYGPDGGDGGGDDITNKAN